MENATPTQLAPSLSDVAYTAPTSDDGHGHLIDLYFPPDDAGVRCPAVIWTSGSAWLADDGKEGMAASVAAQFVPRGYVVIGLSIRSSFQTTFPGQLHDVRAAIRHLRANAEAYRIDPERIAIMGNSSGGWAAAMAAAAGTESQADGELEEAAQSSAVQAAVAFFPPVDFSSMDHQTAEQHETYGIDGPAIIKHDDPSSPEALLIGGPVQERLGEAQTASPLHYINGAEPPVAIFHGTHDPLLPPGQSQQLYQALSAAGVTVSLTLVDGSGHEVDTPHPDAPELPFELGDPILGAAGWESRRSVEGVEQVGAGVAPTWEAVAEFLDDALSASGPES